MRTSMKRCVSTPLVLALMLAATALATPDREDVSKYNRCGVDVVFMTLRRFGRNVSVEELKEHFPAAVFERGVTIEELKVAMTSCDLGYRELNGSVTAAWKHVKDGEVALVPIVRNRHIIACLKVSDERVFTYDPPNSLVWITSKDLELDWSGYGIAVYPDGVSENLADDRILTRGRTVARLLLAAGAIVFGTCGVAIIVLGRRSAQR